MDERSRRLLCARICGRSTSLPKHCARVPKDSFLESRRHLEQEGRLPDAVIACEVEGSNAIGAFSQYIDDENVGSWRRKQQVKV